MLDYAKPLHCDMFRTCIKRGLFIYFYYVLVYYTVHLILKHFSCNSDVSYLYFDMRSVR